MKEKRRSGEGWSGRGLGWSGRGLAEGALAAYSRFARNQIRILHFSILPLSALCLQHGWCPQGAGRIQALRAFRRARLITNNIKMDPKLDNCEVE